MYIALKSSVQARIQFVGFATDAAAASAYTVDNEVAGRLGALRGPFGKLLSEHNYRAICPQYADELDALITKRTAAPDNAILARLVPVLTKRLTALGQSNRDCDIVQFIIGSIQRHP